MESASLEIVRNDRIGASPGAPQRDQGLDYSCVEGSWKGRRSSRTARNDRGDSHQQMCDSLGRASKPDISDRTGKLGTDVSISVDTVSIQSRCSVKAIHDVISRFDDRKRMLVESIGFSGLLSFPPIKSTNRRFSAWLMGNVDVVNSCLMLTDGSRLKFYSKDVAIVFGIPASGKKVNEAGQLNKERRDKMKLQCWPLAGKERQSIKAVEKLVETKYPDELTPDQEDAFKVAFVVFVMSTLFVPGAKHDYVQVDYWGALSDPKSIHEYDWASYVHKRLLTSAAKYKADKTSGSRSPNITGCYLFLQIFYLDNMEISGWSMDHSLQPRVSSFTYERIQSMIAADTHDRHDTKSTCVFGKSKVRAQEQSCYTWAQASMDEPVDGERHLQISLWHAATTMARILRIPLEAAGPLFVAAADFNRQKQTSSKHYGIDCLNVLLNIMEPFVNGFNYNFDLHGTCNGFQPMGRVSSLTQELSGYWAGTEKTSFNVECNCKKRAYGVGSSTASIDNLEAMVIGSNDVQASTRMSNSKRGRFAQQSLFEDGEGSHSKFGGVDYSVIKSMSRFYLLVRCIREHNRIDLNTSATEDDAWCPNGRGEVRVVDGAKSPWELGSVWGYGSHETHDLPGISELGPCHTDRLICTMPRIVHYIPKYIEVMPERAHDQRIGLFELEMDMFDAIIRCFKESDDQLYRSERRLRWRHFFESDILAAVIAGWFDIDNPSTRNQFVGSHLTYDIYNCKMLFFPVILHQRWVCFSWNLKDNAIVVFDPTCINIPGFASRSVYIQVADMLKSVLTSVVADLFPGWEHNWSAASVSPFHWRYAGMQCWNRTGVLCAYFCRCFDGVQLLPDVEKGHLGRLADLLFTEVCGLHGELTKGDSEEGREN